MGEDMETKKKVLDALHRLQSDFEKSRDKKLWSPITVPFTLRDGLNRLTKNDLQEIRRSLRVKKASSLKKAELAALLEDVILRSLESICSKFDSERFDLLLEVAKRGGYMEAPSLEWEQWKYFREYGILYTGVFQGKKIVAVPGDIVEPLLALGASGKVKSVINRNTEWIKLTCGLLFYYGTISTAQIIALLEKYTKQPLDALDFFRVIWDANRYRNSITIHVDNFSHVRLDDYKRIKEEQEIRSNLPFYPFTKKQLLQAADPDFVDRDESFLEFMSYLFRNFKMTIEEAEIIASECAYIVKLDGTVHDVFQYLGLMFHAQDLNQEMLTQVMHFMNHTRQWVLKGHTPYEVFQQEKKFLRPLPETELPIADTKHKKKVGRNDPCPCGSGKKYKKCCGK